MGIGECRDAHAGQAPVDFEGSSFFEEHKAAHAPPIFTNHLRKLERVSKHPFLQHWAFEWKVLRDKLGTRFTRYPHYFDDVSMARAGIIGQYWQRMRDIYLSAYLRTFAYAVSEWHMPKEAAEGYCLDLVHGVTGLFNVEPGTRPDWLADFPERACVPDVDFESLTRDLLQAAKEDGRTLVSLEVPIAALVQRFAKLTLTAHLVTQDYELPDDAFLYEKMPPLLIAETFDLSGPPPQITIEEASTDGKMGNEVSVCNCLFSMPFGTWQSDYFSIGLSIPASYTTPAVAIQCTDDSIKCVTADGKVVSQTRIWNDNWVPSYPKNGSTRCGTSTMLDREALTRATERLGRKLAFFVQLRIWDRKEEYGDYSESKRSFFLCD